MTVGSLFSGIGGFELGLERAGFEIVWQVEKDPFCRGVLARHWPNVTRLEDVHDAGSHNLAPVDVVCGGFPCQPISSIGLQRGAADERWLWPEFARILRELRPRVAVVENVAALSIRGLDVVLGDLAALGYDAEWTPLPAYLFGARTLRDRTFILAYAPRGRSQGRDGEREGERPLEVLGAPTPSEGVVRWDLTESPILRRATRLPDRVDRIRALGNAVSPQVAEFIGRRIRASFGGGVATGAA